MSFNTKIASSVVYFLAAIGTAAADDCNGILKDGVMEITRHDKTVTEANIVRKHVCHEREDHIDDEKAFSFGIALRLIGFKIGLKKADITQWRTANCSADDTKISKSGSDHFYAKRASKAVVDAWLRCKSMNWSSDGWGMSPPVTATDKIGAQVKVQIAVLGTQYHWDITKTDQVLFHGKPIDMREKFKSQFWLDALSNAKDIYAVGTASCGIEISLRNEIDRARRRAGQLLEWMIEANVVRFRRDRPIGIINLGKYQEPYCVERTRVSDLQRPVVVLLVLARPDNPPAVDLRSAIVDAASNHPAFPKLNTYSNFDVHLR